MEQPRCADDADADESMPARGARINGLRECDRSQRQSGAALSGGEFAWSICDRTRSALDV
jgi:hypothetical protein